MARRHGHLFERIATVENLMEAHRKARRGKTGRLNVGKFEAHLDANIAAIHGSLVDGSFTTSPYVVKTIWEPKEREIHILPYAPDRIVQHAIVNVVGPIWERLFIRDSYACLQGKGIHAGSKRTMEFVRQYRYCLKADISKYYRSIDHAVLTKIISRKIKCPRTLALLADIIDSVPGSTGIPIGNYTSQWFGNLYLNELDSRLKHAHHVKGYVRYCDDFCLFDNDKKRLRDLAADIEGFVRDELKLSLSKCDIFPVSRGVDFLGYRHFPTHVLVRKSTAKAMRKRLEVLPRLLESGKLDGERFRSVIASYRGWLKWANAHNLVVAADLERLEGLANAA